MRGKWRGIAICIGMLVVVAGALGGVTHQVAFAKPRSWGNVIAKKNAYLQQPDAFDVVVVGDSRAFCAFQPDLLGPATGQRVVNLAHWGVWLPAQYALLKDLLPKIPPGTTLVWSIGSISFTDGAILPNYPLGWSNLPQLLAAGLSFDQMAENLILTLPPLATVANRTVLRERADQILETPLARGQQAAGAEAAVDAAAIGRVEEFADNGRVVSRGLFKVNGAYLRQEIDGDFYRRRQKLDKPRVFHPEPAYMALFEATLDLLKQSGVRVIVNELEEAPWSYGGAPEREAVRAWMREHVRPEVERHGFAYLRVDFDRLEDRHYFDYNHMNSEGAALFNDMLAPLLADALGRSGA